MHIFFAGLLNPLDSTHHYKANDWSDYREGVVSAKATKDGKGSYVDIGLTKVWLSFVTVKLDETIYHNKILLIGKCEIYVHIHCLLIMDKPMGVKVFHFFSFFRATWYQNELYSIMCSLLVLFSMYRTAR